LSETILCVSLKQETRHPPVSGTRARSGTRYCPRTRAQVAPRSTLWNQLQRTTPAKWKSKLG